MAPELYRRELHAESEAVLASGLLGRATQLARLLRFLSEASCQNRTLSEHDIATGPLRRGDDFDPTIDSIVRSEVRRLRRHLSAYYRTESANGLELVIAPGYQLVLRSRTNISRPGVQTLRSCAIAFAGLEAAGESMRPGWATGVSDDLLTALVDTPHFRVLVPPIPQECEVDVLLMGTVRSVSDSLMCLRLRVVHPSARVIEWQGSAELAVAAGPDWCHPLVEQLKQCLSSLQRLRSQKIRQVS